MAMREDLVEIPYETAKRIQRALQIVDLGGDRYREAQETLDDCITRFEQKTNKQ